MRRRTFFVIASLVAVVSCRKPTADQHMKRAKGYADQSRFDEAIVEYRVAEQLAPNRGDVRLALADVYLRNHDEANAFRETIRGADLLPNDADAQEHAGNMLLLARQFTDARTRGEKALALDPKSARAQIIIGNALAGLRDFDGALNQYQEALSLDGSQDAAYADIAAVRMAQGNLDDAAKSFKKAVEVAPKSVQARLALANFQWSTGHATDAEKTLKDALALNPADIQANRALGVFYLASKQPADAEPYFKTIAATSKTTDATVALADYYVAMKRNDDARKVLTDLVQAHTDAFAVATTRLAAIDAGEGDRQKALARIDEVLAKFPKDGPARLLDARVLLATGKRDVALTEATKLVTDNPTSPQAAGAFSVIGDIQASIDHPEDAIKAYEEVLKRQPQPLAGDLALARLHLASGHLDRATGYVQAALTIDPNNPLSRSVLVRVDLGRGDVQKATEDLASLQRQFPNVPTVLDLAGDIDLVNKRADAARASYAKAYSIAPNDLEATTGLVSLDLAENHAKDAIARIDDGLKVAQPTGDFLVLAARAYGTTGNAAKAEELLKRAIDVEPARLSAYGLLGQLYAREQRLDDALKQFREVVDRNPKSVGAATMVGMLLEAEHRLPEAEAQYQKVLTIDDSAAVAANNLAWLYVEGNRNLDQALSLAQTAQRQLPNEPHVNDTLGWVCYHKNLTSSAVQYLELSAKSDPTDPSTQYHLGLAYDQAGEFGKAKTALKLALASKVSFDGASDAKKALDSLGG